MKALLAPWGFMRVLRLCMGVLIMVQSFLNNQPWIGLLGAFFVLQVLMNTGCSAAGCSPRIDKRQSTGTPDNGKEAAYENVH
ncbi:hypothetical protein [Spirosoma aerophilum]